MGARNAACEAVNSEDKKAGGVRSNWKLENQA